MANQNTQSIEPNIADLANGWMKKYKLDYKLEQEPLNDSIDKALAEYESKNGGKGGNRPDAKLLLQDKNLNNYPILIEYKGYEDKLEKLDSNGRVENRNEKGELLYKNISSYAVNGAVHYANALLQYTTYSEIISIGMTGYKDNEGKIHHSIGVYFVSKNNFGVGQKIGNYEDFSFLKKENFDNFIQTIKNLSLTQEELDKLKEKREREIDSSLVKLNNDIYQNESGLGENDRVYLVAASIISTLGIPGKVAPLEKSDLKSSIEKDNKDGDIILRKISAFLSEKKLPSEKKEMILRTLQNTLGTDNINKPINGESQLKRVFSKIVDDLGIYYKIGLTTDFTGKLFNEMYNWLGFSQDKLNDVVLTPSYVAKLLVKLARVNKDSYVWDFATGSAGLLVSAMNEMLIDAKNTIKSPEQLAIKSAQIKAEQLLGLEILPSVYMLAILNMILMGDGSSNILNRDSLKDFDGKYGFVKKESKFPATAFVLNPPYSASGNGMVFVERALSMMDKGYASIIIQASAGSGKAVDYNKNILKHNTLIASIKMPADLFVGKSKVQTFVYVFKVGEAHNNDDVVRFIDFTNDGYSRANRRKSNSNLRDVDHAKERYQEVVDLVRFGSKKLKYLSESEFYEGTIDVNSGADWNQTAPINTNPTIDEFNETVNEFYSWEVSHLLKACELESSDLIKLQTMLSEVKWGKYKLGNLFDIEGTQSFNSDSLTEGNEYDYVTRTSNNQGILQKTGFINSDNLNQSGVWSLGLLQMDFFYRPCEWYAGQFVRKIVPKGLTLTPRSTNFFTVILNKQKKVLLSVLVRNVDKTFKEIEIQLPTKDNHIDYDFIESFMEILEKSPIKVLENYLSTYYKK